MANKTWTLAAALLLLPACAGDEGNDEALDGLDEDEALHELDEGISDARDAEPAWNQDIFTEADNPIIISLPTDDGLGKLDFIEVPDGGGVGMVALGHSLPQFLHLTDDRAATALEVFLAMRPAGLEAPERLWEDHRALVAAGLATPEPRTFLGWRETDFGQHCGFAQTWSDHWQWWTDGYGSTVNVGSIASTGFYLSVTTYDGHGLALTSCRQSGGGTANQNLQRKCETCSSWTVFYTQSGVDLYDGLAYRISLNLTKNGYREYSWTSGISNGWHWARSYEP